MQSPRAEASTKKASLASAWGNGAGLAVGRRDSLSRRPRLEPAMQMGDIGRDRRRAREEKAGLVDIDFGQASTLESTEKVQHASLMNAASTVTFSPQTALAKQDEWCGCHVSCAKSGYSGSSSWHVPFATAVWQVCQTLEKQHLVNILPNQRDGAGFANIQKADCQSSHAKVTPWRTA